MINNVVITTVLNLLYESKSFDTTMFLILEYVGKMFKLDVCYLFETTDDRDNYLNNHSWSSTKRDDSLVTKNIKKSTVSSILELVDADGVFYTNDIDSFEDSWASKALKNASVKSLYLVDSLDNYEEKTVFFVEDCKSKRVWSEEEVVTLLHISKLLFTAIHNNNLITDTLACPVLRPTVNEDGTGQTDIHSLEFSVDIANLVCTFYNDKDYRKSTLFMLKNIVNFLNLDKVSSYIYNDSKAEYLKAYEYLFNGEFNAYLSKEDLGNEKFVNTLCYLETIEIKKFLSLINENNYIHTTNYETIKPALKSVGYESAREDEITEIYIFTARRQSFFSYIVFERYNETLMSDAEIGILTALCKILNSQVEKFDLIQKYEDDVLMKDVILKNEKIPLAVVDKETFTVLYHNDLYHTIFPTIKTGAVCYELLGGTKKCDNCCLDGDVLIDDANHTEDHQWIKKAIPFTLNSGKEAYMIYSKDSIDYINQLNAVDSLTGALLVRGFEEYYKNFVQKSLDNYALCTIDIDKFKYINEMFSHETGDKILLNIADVIRKFISTEENFCRISGDKFLIFFQYDQEVDLHIEVRKLTVKFEEMKNKEFPDVKITVIGGITLVDKSLNFDTLLDQAELARKTSKGSHTSICSYYNPQFDMSIKKEIKLEEQIPYALEHNEFVPYLQPKFNLSTNTICGAEALVRWISKNGIIYPDEFIPLFERNGFILTLDFIIYDKIMEHIRDCLDTGLPVYPISVNVSRNHVKDDTFLDKFLALIKKYDVPHEYLELEITESTFVEDKQALSDFVDGIKNCNLKVSIDDFGTAYSSLQSLTGIDVDVLKIDKGFLDNIDITNADVTKDEILMKNIISLASDLDFNVVCEGIESEEQVELLKKIACKYGQGYVFAKPMPIEDYKKQFLMN